MTRFQGSAASVLVEDVLQLVLRGAHDSIPNVRFTAVRALQEMAPHLDAGAVDSQARLGMLCPGLLPRCAAVNQGSNLAPDAGWLRDGPQGFMSFFSM